MVQAGKGVPILRQITKPEWVDNIIRALPEEMNEDEMRALILTVVTVYFVEPRSAIPVLMTAPLTYFRAAGLDPENLPVSDPSKMNFGGAGAAKAWKDIWGCGQGIGAVKAVVPAADRLMV